jgi:hypothetical protein
MIAMALRTLPLAGLIFMLAACATSSQVITGQPRPAIDPADVRVYSKAPPEYEEIAILEASSRSSFSFGDQAKTEAMIRRLKERAAALGANGVLLQSTYSESSGGVGLGVGNVTGGGVSVGTGVSTSSVQKVGRGLAIYVPPGAGQN